VNEFLPSRYDERIERLVLGIEPVDALRGGRVGSPIEVALDRPPAQPRHAPDDLYGLSDATEPSARVRRHRSSRYVVVASDEVRIPVALRINDPTRRFVPRRIRYAVPLNVNDSRFRVRRPALFPGAAYDIDETATGLRGRVTWTSAPTSPVVRWARVEATINGARVGYAHGDDRGEFLLVLGSAAGGLGDLPRPLRAVVTVFAPPVQPARGADVFSDLPLQPHRVAGDPDIVSPGTTHAAAAGDPATFVIGAGDVNYVSTADSSREVTFELGRLLTAQPGFFMTP
jgi:hypothetical protein